MRQKVLPDVRLSDNLFVWHRFCCCILHSAEYFCWRCGYRKMLSLTQAQAAYRWCRAWYHPWGLRLPCGCLRLTEAQMTYIQWTKAIRFMWTKKSLNPPEYLGSQASVSLILYGEQRRLLKPAEGKWPMSFSVRLICKTLHWIEKRQCFLLVALELLCFTPRESV